MYLPLRLAATLWASLLLAVVPLTYEPDSPVARELVAAAPHDGAISQQLLQPWFRWDTLSHLAIAHDGYGDADRGLTAFLPVYPGLIAGLGRLLGGEYLLAALIISNAAAVLAFALLHQLVSEQHGTALADRTLAYLALFPTSFFFVAAYTESLFLLWVLLCCRAARHDRWRGASLWAVLAVFTRWQGVALFPALGVTVWRHRRQRVVFWRSAVGLSVIPVAGGAGLLVMRVLFGAQALPWHGYTDTWDSTFVWPGAALARSALAAVGGLPTGGDAALVVASGAVCAAVFYALLVAALRDGDLAVGVYGLSAHAVTTARVVYGAVLQSVTRYVLVVFPAFVVLARIGRWHPWFHRAYMYGSGALWLIHCALFVLWRWVA